MSSGSRGVTQSWAAHLMPKISAASFLVMAASKPFVLGSPRSFANEKLERSGIRSLSPTARAPAIPASIVFGSIFVFTRCPTWMAPFSA